MPIPKQLGGHSNCRATGHRTNLSAILTHVEELIEITTMVESRRKTSLTSGGDKFNNRSILGVAGSNTMVNAFSDCRICHL